MFFIKLFYKYFFTFKLCNVMALVQSSPKECAKDDHAISSHRFSCKREI